MREVKDLFTASAASLWGTMTSHNGTAGFRIPDYQRTYDWSEEKIARLLEDCANGFNNLTQSEESFTFLGTLILVNEGKTESTFDGRSLAVVDGQQRLTTLLLTSCALMELVLPRVRELDSLLDPLGNWIREEADLRLNNLFMCIVGQFIGRVGNAHYPRMIRHQDHRAKKPVDAEYLSLLAKFLDAFARYYEQDSCTSTFPFPDIDNNSGEHARFRGNYEFIKKQLQAIAGESAEDGESEYDVLPHEGFKRKGVRNLFAKLDVIESESEQNRALAEISKGTPFDSLIRLVLFAAYLGHYVVLTRVETDDESSAFDIFDALNTTGEPLTAIETFKPRVIQFIKESNERYEGSDADQAFQRIEDSLNERFSNTDARQRETKESIVSFALYLDGTKESKELSAQRRYLRSRFDKIDDQFHRRQFVRSLADAIDFRRTYWDKNGIQALGAYHSPAAAPELQLCLRFISDMNTSLALPILTRYWNLFTRTGDEGQFVEATRALTAFIVLRRAVTGNTGGIDTVFRSIMANKSEFGDPLCTGMAFQHELLTVGALRSLLWEYLKASKVGITDKESWISLVREVPLALHSKPLVRFLILAASHHALPDTSRPGLLTREGVKSSDERTFLTYERWTSDLYKTVEHVAPDSNPGSGWDDDIYRRPATRHTLGNLTLLPQPENASAGNSGWPWKKRFFRAVTEKTEGDVERALGGDIGDAPFSKKTKELIKQGHRLHLLDPLREVPDWKEEFIQSRTVNLLSLAWDKVVPWLTD